jgi:hypothetical protein
MGDVHELKVRIRCDRLVHGGVNIARGDFR